MKQNIFHNASLRLTTMYVSIILAISLLFSFWLYRISFAEIKQTVHRPAGPIERLLLSENSRFAEELREAQAARIQEARGNLIAQFILLNMVIGVSGGFGSYFLARRTLRPIEEAHEAQSRFAADASHELRTPITAMRIENEVALTDPSLTLTDAKKQLQSTIEELDTLTNLIEHLLMMARIGSEPLEMESVLVHTIVTSAIEKIQPLADQKKQTIQLDKIPKKHVLAHAELLTDAFVTILDNAVKYGPQQSTIHITTKISGREITITVRDEGDGVPEEALAHIFKRFYRADQSRTKDEKNGFGLGLSIAQSIIHAHSGSISVRNSVGKDGIVRGAEFSITLPLDISNQHKKSPSA